MTKNQKSNRNLRSKPNPDPTDRPSLDKEGRKNFLRKIENFKCGNCGYEVTGNGYTDHCPKCLWGKHVDRETPGDRSSDCGGLMEPQSSQFSISNFQYKIKYKCVGCRHEFNVWSAEGDDREILMSLVK